MLDRDAALALWRQYNDDDSLLRHALSVEAAMRHFAVARGEELFRRGADKAGAALAVAVAPE